MKALVTGATGFIGSRLCEDLVRQGIDVRVLARNPSAFQSPDHRVRVVSGDLSNRASLDRALEGIDLVFHLAGLTSAVQVDDYFKTNAEGTLSLLEAVDSRVQSGSTIQRFIYVSSLAAGAPSTSMRPHTEFDPPAPASSYGKSKRAGEDHVIRFKNRFPVVVIRPPMVFGPRDKQLLMLAKVIKKRLVVEVAGSNPERKKYYSMIYVEDLVHGILKAAFSESALKQENPVYYLADPKIYSYDEIVNAMMKMIGVRALHLKIPFVVAQCVAWSLQGLSRITGKSYPMNPDKLHDLKPDYWICSTERARNELGFETRYDLEKGMRETIEWYLKEGWL